MSGWIGVLAGFARHEDVRVAAPAARALANLDVDFHGDEKFHKRIYLLHPMNRASTKATLDVIFIHGLLGGIFVSWRQRNEEIGTVVGKYLKLFFSHLIIILK